MPASLERKLRNQGKKKGLTGKRLDAYIWGTLRKTGWKPTRKRTHKRNKKKGKR